METERPLKMSVNQWHSKPVDTERTTDWNPGPLSPAFLLPEQRFSSWLLPWLLRAHEFRSQRSPDHHHEGSQNGKITTVLPIVLPLPRGIKKYKFLSMINSTHYTPSIPANIRAIECVHFFLFLNTTYPASIYSSLLFRVFNKDQELTCIEITCFFFFI